MAGTDDKSTGDPAEKAGDGTGTEDGAPNSSTTDDSGTSSSQESSKGSEDLDTLKAKLAEANREAAKHRRERNDAKSELQKLQEAQLSETEREKKRASDAEEKLSKAMDRVQESNLRIAISSANSAIVDIEAAALLLKAQGVTFDSEGNPEGIDSALATLLEKRSWLLGESKPRVTSKGGNNGGAGGTGSGEGGIQLTAEELEIAKAFKLSPEDYAKYKSKTPTK